MVYELLNKGKENAITTEELLRVCNFNHKRELMYQIAHERKEGALICSTTSGNGGYYIPNDKEELKKYVNSMDGRAKSIFSVIKSARAVLKEMEIKENGK